MEGRAFVEKNLSSNQAIPVAAELLSINGVSMQEITEKVLTAKSADGLNRFPKYAVANVNFWINYFEMVDDSEVFKIEVRDPHIGKTEQYSTQGVSAPVMQAARLILQRHSAFSLDFLQDGRVALMSIPGLDDLARISLPMLSERSRRWEFKHSSLTSGRTEADRTSSTLNC